MSSSQLDYQLCKAPAALAPYVDFYWTLCNPSSEKQDVIVLPDGRIDILFSLAPDEPYQVLLMGLTTEAESNTLLPFSKILGISFSLLGLEYLIAEKDAYLLNGIHVLATDFWGITENDLKDFEGFCQKISLRLLGLLTKEPEEKKLHLFQLIYASNGTIPVQELSEKVFWSSRQINRYFKEAFGLSLKTYCTILRFRASFPHLKEGKLYPEQNYSDQAHFIKEVKKFSGVAPKELSKNAGNRFVHLSTLANQKPRS